MRGLRGADEARDAPVLWMPDTVEEAVWEIEGHRGDGGGWEWPSGSDIPISLVLTASGHLSSVTNFFASRRTS